MTVYSNSRNPDSGKTAISIHSCDPRNVSAQQLESLYRLLDPTEQHRADRQLLERDRTAFVVGHGFLRLCLSRNGDAPPAAWRFAREPAGRPVLSPVHPGSPGFSLSHVPTRIACGAAPCAIGVDVTAPSSEGIVRDVLSPAERRRMTGLSPAAAAWCFAEIFAIKEAALKCLGTGLRIPPEEVEVPLGDDPGEIRIGGESAGIAAFEVFRVDGHCIAVATDRPARFVLEDAMILLRPDSGPVDMLETGHNLFKG